MPENHRLYLDQMLRLEVAQALRDEGHNTVRASEVGQARADDFEILQTAISENRILVTLDEHFGDWVRVVLPVARGPKRKNDFIPNKGASCRYRLISIWQLHCELSG